MTVLELQPDIHSIVGNTEVIFRQFNVPGQRLVHGNLFPIAFNLSKSNGGKLSLEEGAAALRDISQRGVTTDLMNKHGALIIRGVHDPSAHAFSVLVHAAEEGRGRKPYDQIGLAGSRIVHDQEVFSASEAPKHLWIYHHNEYSRYTKFPSNIHFFCNIAAEEGGESPLAHSGELYDRVMEEMPEFVKRVAEKGLNSPDVYRAPGKEGKNFTFTWAGPLAFGRDIQPGDDMATKKAKAVIQVCRLTPHFWWKDDDALEVHQHVPAVRRHPATGRPVWFNSLAGRYGTAKDRGATDPPYIGDDGMAFPPATYEDGVPLEKEYLHRMWELSNEIQVLIKADPGDLILVDNYQVSHARAPWTKGDRKIMVSMWDTQDPSEKILNY